jgi:hypothetical protein
MLSLAVGQFAICPEKQRTPTSGGKLVGALRLRRGGYATRLCFFKREMKPALNRLPKIPQDAFSVGVRYHDLRESCRDLTLQAGDASAELRPFDADAFKSKLID